MTANHPNLIVISGPNGAGKSSTADSLLKGTLEVNEFVDADLIAQGLSGFQPGARVFHAGRIMLTRIHHLAEKRIDFAFETTLASRTFAPWITKLRKTGYSFYLVFLWLPNEDFAVARVAERVRMEGHDVPEETIRRRYHAGLYNFFKLYHRLADRWYFHDNSGDEPRLIAYGEDTGTSVVKNKAIWHNIKKIYEGKSKV